MERTHRFFSLLCTSLNKRADFCGKIYKIDFGRELRVKRRGKMNKEILLATITVFFLLAGCEKVAPTNTAQQNGQSAVVAATTYSTDSNSQGTTTPSSLSVVASTYAAPRKEEQDPYQKVAALFTTRYMIANPDSKDIHFALPTDPDNFIYRVTCDSYNKAENLYMIAVMRSTDTVRNYFYYNSDKDVFYADGNPRKSIDDSKAYYFHY